jgi:hypothetical protein
MIDREIESLTETVQYNCHVSDARYGADDSLCVYLLKMREYYRWEKRLPLNASLERDRVGEWLADRERLWEGLEDAELRPLEIDGHRFDPFDSDGINARLASRGLVYSGGFGRHAKPNFVLGDLECRESRDGCSVWVVAEEHARDLGAPPAMYRSGAVFLRRESLRRFVWERMEGWRWTRPDNALGRAFACDDFDGDLDGSLERMTDRELQTLLLHELGEHRAGLLLGAEWESMLVDLKGTPAEICARAVRDHLADCLETIPALAERGVPAALHFYVGNATGMRREIFPSLFATYRGWVETSAGQLDARAESFVALAERGRAHWERVAGELLGLYRERGTESTSAIRALVESNPL